MAYEGIDIDPERGWEDVEQQVTEIETHELLAIYDMFVDNPTMFTMVANELTHRAEHGEKLATAGEADEIADRGLTK